MRLTVRVECRSRRFDHYDIDIPEGSKFDPGDPRDVKRVIETGVFLKSEFEDIDLDPEDMEATIISVRRAS